MTLKKPQVLILPELGTPVMYYSMLLDLVKSVCMCAYISNYIDHVVGVWHMSSQVFL